uniref:COMM domain containing 9 n=1 Tax=Phasianus colchicus TaxID=9054 RepID=A0A669PJR8_PHACC
MLLPFSVMVVTSRFVPRQASSKDAVRQLCQECFSCPPGRLALPSLFTSSFPQLVSALHSLTRHVVFCGLTGAEDILALFPENFHQNLKNLLTKIILENVTVAEQLLWMPTCLIQEDAALCRNSPVVSALTVELSKETLDTMLEGLGRIRDQLSAVANK